MDNIIADNIAQVLKTVGHPLRLKIVESLETGELRVNDIVARVGSGQAVVSRHLALMKDKGILSARRDGTNVYYTIQNRNVISLLHCVYSHAEKS